MSFLIAVTGVALGFIAAAYVSRRCFVSTNSTIPLPPGPPGIPWIGNVVGIDPYAPWTTYRQWAKTYGNLLYSRVLGMDVIIINSEKVAKDLLDNRSLSTSSRPPLVTSELCGVGFTTSLLPYGDTWRLHRRFFHQTYRSESVSRFLPYMNHKACQILLQLFANPEQFGERMFEYSASVILSSAYDYDPPSNEDELFKMVVRLQDIGSNALRPDTAILLTAFPILLKLPAWFPGMSFKNDFALVKELAKQCVETGFRLSMQKPAGHEAPSMVHDALQNVEERGNELDPSWLQTLKDASATAFFAASEASHSVLLTFFLMVMLNPSVQEKAQAQIDKVVGKNRLPTMEDRPLLPYLDAVFWESLRYNPVTPLSIPHATVEDVVYNGFRIPKGATILANLWAMAHDESKYPNPDAFIPERFLNDDGTLKPNTTDNTTFGFGRRMCVGQYFADTSVWVMIARFLAIFKILKPLDENGVEIHVEPKFKSGIATRPVPFGCRIVPRVPDTDLEKLKELIAASNSES